MAAGIGAIASLAQMGIGLYQQNQAKIANEKAVELARAQPKLVNPLASQQIPVEAYANQEQQLAQTQANLIDAVSQQGVAASIGALPLIGQQVENANANITAQKAKDIANLKSQELTAQQQIDADYQAYQRQLDQMEILGSGAAQAQGGAMTMAGLGGLAQVGAVQAGKKTKTP